MKKYLMFIIIFVASFLMYGCDESISDDCTLDDCKACEECETCEECNVCEECKPCEECPKEEIKEQVLLGIDNIDDYIELFKDKRVGLITNPTGINSEYKSTIDVLYEHEDINLVSLFAPEHGIRGNTQAGGSLGNEIDAVTGLTVHSLYGSVKKPTKEMMQDIDILCIDIQDVGARFYTYVYTMAYAMSACAEYQKTFVVFDRPNPVSGNVVDGNLLNDKYSSFVGMYPIVTRHGMTIGELASFFNIEYGIGCELQVIKMKNWERDMYHDDTLLPWVSPSPNMPTLNTALVYTATCYFEGVNLSEGRGTTRPFEYIGAPFIDPNLWAKKLNDLKLQGVIFRPIYFTPTFDDYANTLCGGVQIHITNRDLFVASDTGFAMLYTIKELYPNDVVFSSYVDTLSGVDYIRKMTYSLDDLKEIVSNDVNTFMIIREKYLLY